MKISPKNKLSLLFLLAFLIIVATPALVILPLLKEMKSLSQKLYDQRVNYEFITEQTNNIALLQKEIKAIENEREKITPALMKKNDTLGLITTLENISERYNLKNQKINFTDLTPLDSGLMVNTLNIDITATYENLIRWLEELEQQPFYLIINNINLNVAPGVTIEENNLINSNISAKVFWQ